MNHYTLYLWSCFLMAFGLLGFNMGFVWLEWRQAVQQLRRKVSPK